MVQTADGYRESVTDFSPHRRLLCKLDVVGIRRGATADKTGLSRHELQVFAVVLSYWFTDDGDRRFAGIGLA